MKVINFAETPSLVGQYMTELRAVDIQGDMLRFRRNLERIGEIMAYDPRLPPPPGADPAGDDREP